MPSSYLIMLLPTQQALLVFFDYGGGKFHYTLPWWQVSLYTPYSFDPSPATYDLIPKVKQP
jgi:hypothetical protein